MDNDDANAYLKQMYKRKYAGPLVPMGVHLPPEFFTEGPPPGRPLATPLIIPRRRRTCATADPRWRPRR